ncbi:unnamed protein product [Colias eurytheme]|nr:unnamed protein product [Colias eurytheme]
MATLQSHRPSSAACPNVNDLQNPGRSSRYTTKNFNWNNLAELGGANKFAQATVSGSNLSDFYCEFKEASELAPLTTGGD